MFSQMSPTFAEALVLATDMASAKHAADTQASTTLHQQGIGQASVNKKVTSPAEAKYIENNIHETFMDKAQGNIDDSSRKCGSSETSCDIQDNICQQGAAVTAVSVTPETLNSHVDPTINTTISEMEKECVQQGQDDIASGAIDRACSRHDTALPESGSEVKSVLCQQDSTNTAKQETVCLKNESNTSIVCTQQSDSDSLTAVFKSKSKSARRFYYPSSRSCASRSHLQQKSLLSKMTPLEKCSDTTENGKTAEPGENNTSSDLEQSSITSSTPTVPKRSAGAFMSFTAYMKSVESQQTPRDSVTQKVQSSATPVSGSAGKYETPRTSRETGTNPGLGCRRRVGNFYQPAAKKLKTVAVLNTVPNGVNKNQGCESFGDVSSNMTPGNNSLSERSISCVDMKPAGVESFIQRNEQKNIGSLDGLSLKNTHGQLSPHAAQTAVISTQTLHSAQSTASQSAIQSDHKSENKATQMGNVMGQNEISCGNTRSNKIAKSQNSHEGVCDTSIPYEQTGMYSQEKVFTADKGTNQIYTIPEKNTAFHDLSQNQDQCEFAGFCTASGAKITVSESAMSKARKLVEEVELEKSVPSSIKSNKDNLVQGQTSAGDHRTDSKESEWMIKPTLPLQMPYNDIKLDSSYGGFTAASGKKITVSDTAMKRAQSILQQVDDCLVSSANAVFEGFKSASGKSISVSDTAMRKAKSILEDVNCDVIQNESNSTKGFTTVVGKDNAVPSAPNGKTKLGREGDSGFVPAKDSKDFVGFTSASGKSIAVSETAMRKAKSILEQVDSSITEIDNAKDENDQLHVQSFTGFVSASGKDINISAAAMLKAKQLVSEIEKNEKSQVKADAGAGNSALSRTARPVPRPQRDFQRMPKGFRPFKPPSRVRVPTRDVTEALETPQTVNSEVTSCTHTETQSHGLNAKDDAEDPKEKCHAGSVEERENTQIDLKNADCEEKSEDLNGTFNDDDFSATQVRRELEAVEQLEMQMAGITEDDLINMNDDDMTLDDEKSPDEMKSEVGEIGCQSQAPDAQSEGHTMAVQNSECGDDRSQTKTAVEEEPAQQTAVPDTGDHQLMIVDDASRCNTDDKQLLTVAKQVKSKIEDSKPATDPEGILDKAICAEHDFSTDDEVFLNFGKCEMWENDNKHCEVGKHQVTELDKANRNGEESRDDLDSETVKADVQSAEKEGKQAGFITFQGFQTASGNTVQVSEESLALAKKMFEDDENSHHGNSDAVEDTHLLDGACTAVGMVTSHAVDVNVHDGQSNTEDREGSDRGVSIAESAEATQPDTDGVPTVLNARIASEMHDPSDGRLSKTVDVVGFKTASGQSVSVSEESLFKARKLFSESGDGDLKDGPETSIAITRDSNCVSAKPRELTTKENSCPSPPKPFLGFQTAGGSKVTVSEDSLKKAKLLLAEETANTEYTVFQKNINTLPEFTGFQTAGGRKVTVSEESLKKAKGLFSEVEMSECSKNNESKTDRDNSVKKKSTAQSDNSLVPSKVNEGGRSVVNNRLTTSTSTNPQANAMMSSGLHTKEPFLGFRTGSGSAVQISEASLKRARDFLASDDDNFNTESEKGHTGGGFQTASGTKISVSREALAQAKNFLKDVDANGGFNELCAKTNTNEPLIGFKTARGAQVSISEKSLEKARRLLAEDMADKESCVYGREESMFTTAGGNAVTVSSSALDKAKEFINKEDVETTPNPPEGFCGFQTGLGKPVKVSAESMAKARRLLADTEQSDSTETSGDKKTKSQIATTGSLSTEHTVRTWPSTSDKLSSEVSCEKSKSSGVEMKRLPIKRTYPSAGIEEPPRKKANIGDFNQAKQKKALLTSPTGFANDRTQKFTRAMQPLVSSPLITSCDNASVTDIHPTVSATTQNASGSNYTTRKPSTVSRNQRLISGKASSFKTPFRNNATHARRAADATDKGVSENKQGFCPLKKKSRSDLNSGVKDGNGGGQEDAEVRLSRRKSMPASADSSGKDQHHDMTRRRSLRQQPRCSSWTAKAMQAKKGDCKVTAVRPVMGALYSKRLRQPRIALHQLVKGQAPSSYTEEELHSFGVPPNTVSVKCSNAESYRFHGRDHYSESVCCSEDGVTLTDGGVLHLDGSGTIGKEQFLSALYSTPGVDSELISEEWVSNHYKWIVWKLAAMEVAYPNIFASRFLTPDMVMLQLKYRYDREIDHSHRSAIKKILERDDTPSRRLVLCVSAISVNTDSDKPSSDDQNDDRKQSNKDRSMAMTLELTDGWYGIKTIIDRPLTKLASCGKIQIGTKLCIYGAEVIGSQDACSPLEAPSNLALKICANSTRRARYDARLGYQSTPHPYPVLLNSLYADGGLVGCVDVVVVRSYPMQYVEKLSDGSNIVRSSKAEQKAAEIFEREKQKRLDQLYSKLRDEFEKREANTTGKRKRCRPCGQKLSIKEIEKLESGQEIFEAIQGATDPSSIEAYLNERQFVRLQSYRQSLNEKKQFELQAELQKALADQSEEFPSNRNVTGIFKVRVTGYTDCEHNTSCILTVWRPSEDVMNLLCEGARLRIYNLSTSASRSRHGGSEVQLSSMRTTRYKQLAVTTELMDYVYQPRVVTDFSEMSSHYFEPVYNEVDVVGLVVFVSGLSGSGLQSVYIADANQNIIAIKFWGGVQNYHVEEMLKVRNFIAAANLQWRADDRSRLPCVFTGDLSAFTQKPRESHLKAALAEIQNKIKDPKSFIEDMQDVMDSTIFGKGTSNVTPLPGRYSSRLGFKTPGTTPAVSHRSRIAGNSATPTWHATLSSTSASDTRHLRNQPVMKTPISAACADSSGTPQASVTHSRRHAANTATMNTPITAMSSRTFNRVATGMDQGSKSASKPNDKSMPGPNTNQNSVAPLLAGQSSIQSKANNAVTPIQPGKKSRLLTLRSQDFTSHSMKATPDYLSQFPSPPPLSPLPSPLPQAVRKSFRPPIRLLLR
ncbi:breast cancer type 2 susceptibility protein-like [Ptychodera flava]|uniref:breast cancer type 2 susceptibility protein-like n=1 Tax=Ptychodera flava TaxID=63121 RepID=UPI00396A78A9